MKNSPPQRATDPPKTLSAPTRELWKTIVREYDIGDQAGLIILRTACEAHDMMLAAQKLVDKHGVCIPDRFGVLKSNPATVVVRDSRAAFLRALRDLNLDLEPLHPDPGRPRGS